MSYTPLAKPTIILCQMSKQEKILFKYQRGVLVTTENSDGNSNLSMPTAEMATHKPLFAFSRSENICTGKWITLIDDLPTAYGLPT